MGSTHVRKPDGPGSKVCCRVGVGAAEACAEGVFKEVSDMLPSSMRISSIRPALLHLRGRQYSVFFARPELTRIPLPGGRVDIF